MKTDQFHEIIRKNGWVKIRQTGSHVIYEKDGRRYPVAYHKGKDLSRKTEMKIRKDMGLK